MKAVQRENITKEDLPLVVNQVAQILRTVIKNLKVPTNLTELTKIKLYNPTQLLPSKIKSQ